ncbi:MAG: phosphoglycerate kinase [Candidatus Latescibacteria bacterium]|nr:phosphoglycerate kinase [Candidatus Latescibacterota bacterium]
MKKLTIRDIDISNKKVLVRVDFNVPFSSDGKIADDTRIRAALPTIEYLLKHNCLIVLISHLGKPKGKIEAKYSLQPVAQRLSELMNKNVVFASDCIGADVENSINQAKPGDIVLLENLRSHIEEEKNEPNFAKALASLSEIYVNDAFATAHRAHASTENIARYFTTPVAGLLMEKEIEYLSYVVEQPKSPFIAVIGGAKIKDKLGVIKNLLPKVDALLIGGGLIYNFLKAQGLDIGNSIYQPEMLDQAKDLLSESKLRLPVDVMITDKVDVNGNTKIVKADSIENNWAGIDIGNETVKIYTDIIKTARTVVWAGPIGVFEIDRFAAGSKAIAETIAETTKNGATSVVGGGDTVACLAKFGLKDKVSFVSTGGSASLEFLEGLELPGIKALKDKELK